MKQIVLLLTETFIVNENVREQKSSQTQKKKFHMLEGWKNNVTVKIKTTKTGSTARKAISWMILVRKRRSLRKTSFILIQSFDFSCWIVWSKISVLSRHIAAFWHRWISFLCLDYITFSSRKWIMKLTERSTNVILPKPVTLQVNTNI